MYPPTCVRVLMHRVALKTGYWSLHCWTTLSIPSSHYGGKIGHVCGPDTSRRDGSGWTVETQAGLVASHLAADWSTTIWVSGSSSAQPWERAEPERSWMEKDASQAIPDWHAWSAWSSAEELPCVGGTYSAHPGLSEC